jgi:leucyl-tRNA synthetase
MLAPMAPHLAEELWQLKVPGTGSVHNQTWPEFNTDLAQEDRITLVVQVNGKLRDRLEMPVGLPQEEVEQLARNSERVAPYLENRSVRRVIVVPEKLVNIVVG